MAGAHERGAELDRGERPRFLDPAQDARSQRGGPRVTRLQPVERPGEVAAEPGLVDTVMAEDPRDVPVRPLFELHEEALPVHVVVRAGQALPGWAFERCTARPALPSQQRIPNSLCAFLP